jgi:hypothetical protein
MCPKKYHLIDRVHFRDGFALYRCRKDISRQLKFSRATIELFPLFDSGNSGPLLEGLIIRMPPVVAVNSLIVVENPVMISASFGNCR